jgi:hypothetical protein
VAHFPELELALRFFPLDPALPALAELTGRRGPELLAAHLSECRAGARIERIDCALSHYKPFKRAVLKIRADFVQPGPPARMLYAKAFADERGLRNHRDLSALWATVRAGNALKMPEPLGYDAALRVLFMSEAAGQRELTDWIKCLERGEPLPAGVSAQRLERCMIVVAQALAELQASGVRLARRRTFQQELVQLAKDRQLLRESAAALPARLVGAAEELLSRLEALAPESQELRPAHGGLRHKQMVGDEHDLGIIDWDGLCLADPALDPATFLGRLRQETLRNPGSAPDLERLAEIFRREVLARLPYLAPQRLALYEGLVLIESLLRSFRRPARGDGMEQQILSLARAVAGVLERAAPSA